MILEVMRVGQIRYVTDAEVQEWAPIPTAIALVAEGFAAEARGEVRNFPVVREMLPEHGGIFGVKSGFLPQTGVLGLKSGGYWKQNPARYQVGAHQSTVLLFNPESGELRGVVAANYLTGLRTGAVGAVAARALARPGAAHVGLIGTGVQAAMQLRCLAAVFEIERVLVWSPRPSSVDQFVKGIADLGLKVIVAPTPERVVREAEIVVTTTPAFEPLVHTEWLHPGLHINAIGADTRNKQELATDLIPKATQVIVDSFEQACELGELQHPFRAGLIGREQVVTLGQVLIGGAQGRRTPDDVTVFDSTGLMMQDLVVADHVWRHAATK